MSAGVISRGHPVVALLALILGWAGGRAATWDAPLAAVRPALVQNEGPQSLPGSQPLDTADLYAEGVTMAGAAPPLYVRGSPPPYGRYRPAYRPAQWWEPQAGFAARDAGGPAARYAPHLAGEFAPYGNVPRFYAPDAAPSAVAPVSTGVPSAERPARLRRWSMDAWALLRRDDAGAPNSAGLLPATYGASQTGAVLRYRIKPSSRYGPSIYLRATSSQSYAAETALALGVSARPFPDLPVIAAVEGRVTDQGGERRYQPAVMAITELPPFALPAGLRGEFYGQAGYVGGRYATLFADGQLRVDRPLFRFGKFDARAGGGLWGGAQKGVMRIDAGPSASISMPLGRGLFGRAAVDWRFRMAGDAVPRSGPALTLSAGF
ncbi:hypothetical protein [Novosphingobium sp. Leaf2]|uniref:hypothetical protein n=1 Tax=Novosphingobium sp. Leaf2 TaxID=1735670 RepID=UPI0006FBF645|nr:hypothetical protein [Novosphingobium sp. Leaf2]KQM18726.1 hypothetical protein ASE49_06080 [Novosphingobium sp. Leaf2]